MLSSIAFGLLLCATATASAIPSWHPRCQHLDASNTNDSQAASNPLTIKTASGTITGFVNETYPDVYQFLGIPFAQPPIDELRFEPPEVVRSSEGKQIDATSTLKACPQLPPTLRSVFSESSPEFFNTAPWDEDCLTLSVWAPKDNKKSTGTENGLPVIIWVHGMGLQQGSSSVPYQQPTPWVQRSQEHIVVAVQYRLNIFGFPNAAGLDHTNLGLLDQRMAIEWVRDNIRAFGGDPERMTLWGESSGGAAVDAQNFAFPEDPIVQGFISDSGNALFAPGTALSTFDPQHTNFSSVAKGLDCPSDPKKEAECMRKKPAKDIINYMKDYMKRKKMPPLLFVGTPDDKVVFANYTERYEKGLVSDRPAIIGSNKNEGVAQFPLTAHPKTQGPDPKTAEMVTLGLFQCPTYFSGVERERIGRKTYQYMYTGNFTDISPLFWEGAYHMSELPQVFGTRGEYHGKASEEEIKASNAMQDAWLAFAKDPSKAEEAGWAEFASGELVVFGDNDDVMKKEKISEWDSQCDQIAQGMSGAMSGMMGMPDM